MKIHLQTDQSQREHCLKMPRNSPRNSLTLSSSVDGAVLSKSPRRTKQALDCIQCSFRNCCKVLVPIPTQTHHHLERFTTLTNSTRGQRSLGLQFLLTCAILVVVASFANGQQQKETPLPTVIVRGFLNYRTTVDGTVLLFTPDAGQQQQAPASAAQPKASSSMTRIEQTVAAATATSTHPLKSSLVYTETLAQPIEPTSTQAMATATDLFQTVHLDSNSFRHNNQNQNNNNQHQTPPQTIAADQRAGQPDEWRPIQMTPPLPKMTQPLPDKPAANSESASTTTSQPKPSVQADDVAVEPARQAGSSASSTPPSTSSETPPAAAPTGRPRRPSLGFSGQGLRPRVPGTAGAVSPSLQGRSRSTDGASTPNSINGIRRPGLASSSAASSNGGSSSGGAPARSQVATDPVVSANVSSAFQNRLSNASTRLKNRFKHRQPTATSSLPQPTTPSPAPSPSPSPTPQASSRPAAAAASSGSSASQPKQHNSLIAPESLLDVASSIEQPTSAARSQSLVPQSNRNGPAGSSELSSSGPAVGSDEIVAAAAAAPSSPTTEHQHQEQAISGQATSQNSNTPEQQQDSFVPMVASSPAASAEGEPIMEPMSPEQQAGMAALSRSGEQQPKSQNGELLGSDGPPDGQQARVLSGQLQQGSLSSGPLNLDALFLSDQPSSAGASGQGEPHNQASSEPAPSHLSRSASLPGYMRSHHHHNHTNGNLNGKLNGWLGQHHNKFVPRPAAKPHSDTNLSQQLAANIQQLAPTPVPPSPHNQPNNQNLMSQMSPQQDEATSSGGNSFNSTSADGSAQMGSNISMMLINNNDTTNSSSFTASSNNNNSSSEGLGPEPMSMQTITRTYSTILETTRTRLVPMQVKSSTGIITVTEDYIMTKMMTAYQTIPASAEFILADQQLSTRAPYEIFESSPSESESKIKSESVPPAAAAPAIVSGPIETQEQPISLDNSPKSANNWLHDFSNLDGPNLSPLSNDFSNAVSQQQLQQQQQQSMLAILEQQARDANLAPGFPLMSPNGEPLDQLASQLDPSSLLAEGAINIPDLNNPLVLAAAIQNPQLAAVILAAQQLKLKRQQQQQLQFQKPLLQQQQLQNQQLQPSYSTSFSTTVRPSTYTARDTMYTTRLVSFRDGRTVRTRTVSEPGSVIEQVLTTIVTETIPVTVTIKPTAVLGATGSPATALPTGPLGQVQSNQATINNALFATQLANILARRQQQLQTSFNSPSALINPNAGGMTQAASATPQQLLAFQQYINQQQKRQQQQNQQPQQQQQQQQQQQFQPNFQQLLQSMSSSNASTSSSSQAARQSGANSQSSASQSATAASPQQDQQHQATPALQQPPKSVVSSATPVANVLGGPLTTTLTSLQTRTYTVHNAFKTIFRTITSTVLIPTVLAAGSTLMPMLG